MIEKENFENCVRELKSLKWNDMYNGADVEIPNGGMDGRFMYHLVNGFPYKKQKYNIMNGYELVLEEIKEFDCEHGGVTQKRVWKTPWNDYYYFEIYDDGHGGFILEKCYKVEPYEEVVTNYKEILE